MIRFRNPGSDWDTLIAIYKQLYNNLKEYEYFTNDLIASVLSHTNLMASSGFTGEKALELGANKDRTRDKTYNNAKMYAETFRLLGLISSINDSASQYKFTFIGDHLALDGADCKALIEQCILGLNNPNEIIDVSYKESVRFFACVLLTLEQLDCIIYRDEMILGPMSTNDNSDSALKKMISNIKKLRNSHNISNLETELEKFAKSQRDNKKEGMTVTSVRNCTRFPISVLKYCNWVEDYYSTIYGKSLKFMKLTQHGKETINMLKLLKDMRLEDYLKMNKIQQNALIRLGGYQMLARANFDTAAVVEEIKEDQHTLSDVLGGKELLFSPFQTLKYDTVTTAFGLEVSAVQNGKYVKSSVSVPTLKHISENAVSEHIFINNNVALNHDLVTDGVTTFVEEVQALHNTNSIPEIIKNLIKKHEHDNKDEYYPFIETLFRIIGVDCHKTRDGVNGERWDAMIRDAEKSIPIEIKSPGEEPFISIKAIRQALENKIVLLSRNTYHTKQSTSSFAVGYYSPNDRAEVSVLIKSIKETYGFKIAVFDIESLLKLAVNVIINQKGIDIEKLYELEGIVDVENLKS